MDGAGEDKIHVAKSDHIVNTTLPQTKAKTHFSPF
jgi:hypothetical protein